MIARFFCRLGFHRMRTFFQGGDVELVTCVHCHLIREVY